MTDSQQEGGEREPWSPADRPAGVGSRREQRERALTLLYEAESKDVSPAAVLASLPVEPSPFAAEVVAGVGEHVDELDKWITEGDVLELVFHDGNVVDVNLPASVELEVTETEPGIQGDRVSGARKAATLETGLTVQVPLFVETGERIKIDTRTGEYLARA